MIPKVKFQVVDNPLAMISLIDWHILNPQSAFNAKKVYFKEYPQLKKLLNNIQEEKDIIKTNEKFFLEIYNSNLKELNKIKDSFQKEWDKQGDNLLLVLSQVLEKEWPNNCKKINPWISLNPICPRFLDNKSFDVYWKCSIKGMKSICLHEILHFLWFEKWKEIFPEYSGAYFESPSLIWKLSEIVPIIILKDKRIQKVFKHKPLTYEGWSSIKIEGKSLSENIQEIYNKKTSFEEFMRNSWGFVKKHEKEFNNF